MNSTPLSPSALIRVALGAVMALAVLAHPGIAAAQCPPTPKTEHAIDAASSVFVGRVVSTQDLGLVAEMQVLSIWKGRDLPEVVGVQGSAGPSPSSDDRRFEDGRTYLVIPENSRTPFLATACNATQPYAGAPSVIPASYQEAAGATAGHPPIGSQPVVDSEAELTTSILPLLGLIALIAATWFAISRMRTWEPERAPSATPEPVVRTPSERDERRFKARNLQRDVVRTKGVARKTVRRHTRGLSAYRRRQNRQIAKANREDPK